MNESRVFMLNGTEVSQIVTRLENFFRTEKGMEVQSSQTTDGYVMQASQPKDGWKTLTGMRLALTVQMAVMGDKLNDMWNVVQNHHADNSLTFEHPVFSKIRRAWFSTVRSEINRRFAISFLLAPHANNSAISDSRLVSFTASIIKPPTRL